MEGVLAGSVAIYLSWGIAYLIDLKRDDHVGLVLKEVREDTPIVLFQFTAVVCVMVIFILISPVIRYLQFLRYMRNQK